MGSLAKGHNIMPHIRISPLQTPDDKNNQVEYLTGMQASSAILSDKRILGIRHATTNADSLHLRSLKLIYTPEADSEVVGFFSTAKFIRQKFFCALASCYCQAISPLDSREITNQLLSTSRNAERQQCP